MYTKLAPNEPLENRTRNAKVLLYFTASWCGPCQQLKPILKSMADEVTVVEIDVDAHGDLADTHEVQGIPLLKYVVDGDVAWKSVGVVSRDEILRHVA